MQPESHTFHAMCWVPSLCSVDDINKWHLLVTTKEKFWYLKSWLTPVSWRQWF